MTAANLCRLCRARHKRHTYASLLIAQGAHPKYIQAQLGHASIQTTLDRAGTSCRRCTRRKRGNSTAGVRYPVFQGSYAFVVMRV